MTNDRFLALIKWVLERNEKEEQEKEALKHYQFNIKLGKKGN